jgi:predicted GNAT superfamily acetyltransferase
VTSITEPVLRPLREGDLEALVAINDGAYPAVPITPLDEFAELLRMGDVVLVVDDGAPAGFLLTMSPGLDYASENYRWFSARSSEFLYIDRIVLAPRIQGLGLGRRLYEAAFEAARSRGASELFAEVNLEPPNPGSLAFHARMGFERVGEQPTKDGTVVVALLAAPVTAG